MSLLYRYLVFPWIARHEPIALEAALAPIDGDEVLPEAAARFADAAGQLIPVGFVFAGYFRQPEVPNRRAFLAMWIHEGEGVIARAVWIRIAHEQIHFTMTSFGLSFTTAFDDGREVVTTNAPTVSVFPTPPSVDVLGWKDMNHAGMLWKVHRARSARLRESRSVVIPPMASDAAGLEKLHRETEQRVLDLAIRGGYARRDRDGAVHKTLRGSYLMTWRLLWPWKQIKLSRADRKLRRVLSEFPDLAAEARALPPSPPAVVESFIQS